jgi:hypothetical protein
VDRGAAAARVTRHAPDVSDIPVVAMSGKSETPCVFVTSSDDRPHGANVTDWHPAFRRYGASELNERFAKTFGKPMNADAWHGWVAVKAVFEAAMRGQDLCGQLARLRFDGHKGRALRFDLETRRLLHPALLVRDERGTPVIEVVP